ncbi:serine-rich coiled-coil domain-containing protein 1 isoform X1 [Nerophis ophidion]|uniref:serine-rich coiled-coil domain-containing protein 1 isoform X1 n=3 Tax=Nerophis ophidion TaxID=159077 RepID=UPI002ADF9F5C|nr:serine-rich coiled-coil domain-containing protein 1 isoform X1 [Nerophis ophidion]
MLIMKLLPHPVNLSMGESGSRRSTLVSRLPIFRRSNSKRQESLPSSPSSGGNCVHTSSPSSTNSSSGSTGKRRSLFRAPSLNFSAKRNSHPRVQPVNLNLTPPPAQTTDANGNNQTTSAGSNDGSAQPKSRHSFGFGSSKHKKITRSQTEDFDKAPASSSSTTNRNVFINCLSGSVANEGDDSGFIEDYSGGSRRSSRHKKQLLPKSLSSHHRFSRPNSDHHKLPEDNLECPSLNTTTTIKAGGLTPGSWPGDIAMESSLQSPMVSEDRTTAITPSEFVPITEDSGSEVEALPAPSPRPTFVSGPATAPSEGPPAPQTFSGTVSSSQVFFTPAESSKEKPLLPDTSTGNNTDYETAISLSEPETAVPCVPPQEQLPDEMKERAEEREQARNETSAAAATGKNPTGDKKAGCRVETTCESEAGVLSLSEACHSYPEQAERRTRNTLLVQERGSFCGYHEPRSCHLRKPHTASLCSSVSPYHEVMRLERRLRSSSEGAGGPRVHGNAPGVEGCSLLKHRNNSSSSKLGSLEVLNNLGSSELDEDDLMLDLDLSDDQRHRHVSREDSSQSLASCLNLLPSSIDPSGDRILGKDYFHREPRRPTSLLPADSSNSAMLSGKDDEHLPSGAETLPLRLMQQDCTAVKTLLLRLRHTLQESTETSPASSLQSLPISPCSEKSLPFKDWSREEALLQQLKEKDELILRLQSELESAKAALKMKDGHATDRATQTEHMGPEANNHAGRWSGSGSSSLAQKERRVARAGAPPPQPPAGDLTSAHPPRYAHSEPPASARDETPPALPRANPWPAVPSFTSRVSSSSESLTPGGSTGPRRGEHHPPSHIPRAFGSRSSSSSSSSASSSSSSSPFTGRLGQPPRGPLSLHSFSRKNVFLQHSLHTAELQALTQRDT